jgi:DNA invertase Pin-like site-specific DNA recombinase
MARRTRRPQPADPTHVVIYRRVSTTEQADSGLGLDAQLESIEKFVEARGWTVVASYQDEGVSGTADADGRPGLAAALADIDERRAATLVVAKTDRLARDLHMLLGLLKHVDAAEASVVAVDGTIDTTTPMGKCMTSVAGAFAALERDLIAARTREALAAKKRAGDRLGRPVQLGAEIRERIASMRSSGAGWTEIANTLNADGVPTARGGAWFPSTVRNVVERSLALDAEAKANRIAATG